MRHLRSLDLILDIARSGSVRRTAERMGITPSALTRRVQDFEQELGSAVFERTAQGMRLNPAGELVVRHALTQRADLERVRSQIADLTGVRRGHVAIACSQAFANSLLPQEIAEYRADHPLVSFTVLVRDHAHAVTALQNYDADVALILEPPPAADLQTIHACQQPLCALMRSGHPLAQPGPVRLRDCLRYPIAMPDRALAVRILLDRALVRRGLVPEVAIESASLEFLRNYVRQEEVISFQVPSGIPARDEGLFARPVDARDMDATDIVLGQLRGRMLSVAAAKFAHQVGGRLEQRLGFAPLG
jgi:DNA-binding transcriptional LysR family regulator